MNAPAQTKQSFDLQTFIESSFNLQEEALNYEDLYENLLLLYETPIEINQASSEELQSLYILSPKQITALQNYILENGKLISVYELQYIKEFDYNTVNKLLPFITIDLSKTDERPLVKRILEEQNNYLIVRYERTLERKLGYHENDTRYLGSSNKLYFRYRVAKSGDFSIGFTAEKDPGEKIEWNVPSKQYGTDFLSGHFLIENQGKWRKMVVGDYQLQLGQGLIFGAGFNVGKGSETVNNLQRTNLGIRPYTSVIEGGFLRGMAATYKLKPKLSSSFFFSRLGQDANIRSGSNGQFETYFSSIQLSGFHRTPSEIDLKKAVTETLAGFNIDYTPNERNRLGVIAVANQFSTPILRSDNAYNKFEFSGTKNYNLSLYGNTTWRQFGFFGELALAKSGGRGFIIGFNSSLSPRVDFAMIIRNYQENFHTFRGNAFSEGSRNINEKGIYWGLKYTYNKQFSLSAYYDSFHFPWLRFRTNTPSSGNDFLIRLNYSPNRKVSSYFQIRSKTKDQNFSADSNEEVSVLPGRKHQYLFNLDFRVNSSLSIKSRVQRSTYIIENSKNHGYAFSQDISYVFGKFSISSRIALFDTQGSQNRQYAYERDVLYAFSIPAYSGRGIRNYLLFNYKLNGKIDIWLRVARTTYNDRNEIGTGLETIDGNKKTDIKFQIRYKIR